MVEPFLSFLFKVNYASNRYGCNAKHPADRRRTPDLWPKVRLRKRGICGTACALAASRRYGLWRRIPQIFCAAAVPVFCAAAVPVQRRFPGRPSSAFVLRRHAALNTRTGARGAAYTYAPQIQCLRRREIRSRRGPFEKRAAATGALDSRSGFRYNECIHTGRAYAGGAELADAWTQGLTELLCGSGSGARRQRRSKVRFAPTSFLFLWQKRRHPPAPLFLSAKSHAAPSLCACKRGVGAPACNQLLRVQAHSKILCRQLFCNRLATDVRVEKPGVKFPKLSQ